MEVVWQVEKDEWCSRVLAKHWPNTPRWGDIEDFLTNADEWRRQEHSQPDGRQAGLEAGQQAHRDNADGLRVDLICGGFPCQPVSLAGKRKGREDARWLWPKFADTIRLLRPRYVLAENVPGLLVNGGVGVIEDLAALGYDCEWDCIPAAAVGALHLRYRVFIVAYAARVDEQRAFTGGDTGGQSQGEIGDGGSGVAYSNSWGFQERSQRNGEPFQSIFQAPFRDDFDGRDWWAVEPPLGRVASRVSRRVDRLRGLGNAVVPQVAEWVGERIMEFERTA